MPNRDKHVGKTTQERQSYSRYIKTADYEPTVEEGIDFGSTEKGGEELSESTSQRRPRGYTKSILREHFKEHWVEWVIGCLLLIGLYLINESRVSISIMDKSIYSTNTQVNDISGKINKIDDEVDSLEIQTIINSKDIEYIKAENAKQ